MSTFVLSAFSDEAGASLQAQVDALQANRIGQMEIRGIDGKNVSELTQEQAREIRRKLEDAGITVPSMGSPYGKYPVDAPFGPHLEAFRRGLELCGILGARRMRMFSFYIPKGSPAEDWTEEVTDRIARMLEYAQDAGIKLAHENEKEIYGDIARRCATLADAFGARLELVFDPANFVQCHQDVREALSLLGDRIAYAHIKDALRKDGSVVPAGEGDGEVRALLGSLAAGDGECMLTLEPHLRVFDGLAALQAEALHPGKCYPTPRAAFDAAATALKELLAEMGYVEGAKGTWTR